MSGLRPLALIVAEAREARVDAALSLACAAAALDRRVAMFFHDGSVAALREPSARVAMLLDSARELKIDIVACQTGLDEAGMTATGLPPAVAPGGLVGFLSEHADAELAVV